MASQLHLRSQQYDVEDSPDAVLDYAMSQGWGDGLPVIPPTEERVWGMIQESGLAPDHVVGIVGPGNREATVEKIAINGVMAGCLPEYMPVLVAVFEAVCDEKFNLSAVQTTTNPARGVIIINGPIRHEIGLNCSRGCLGPGWRANATIGRALSLGLMNIGGARPGEVDRSTHGFPGKYGLCFGEDEENLPWEPLHVDRGFQREDSTVTVNAFNGTLNIVTTTYREIKDMLWVMARDAALMGSNNVIRGHGEPVMVITAGHARLAAEAGMSRADVKKFIHDNSGFPASELIPKERHRHRFAPFIENGLVHQTKNWEDVMVVAAGGPEEYHAVLMPNYGDTRAITKLIRKEA